MVAFAHRPAAGERRLDRRQGGIRVPLRKAYSDNTRIRVAGPLTVESLSPHHSVPSDQDDSLIDELVETRADWEDFGQMVFENLKAAGVQQAHKEDRITFTALTPWPGKFVSAEDRITFTALTPGRVNFSRQKSASGGRQSWSAPNSASYRGQISSMPHARRPMPASTW